MLHETNTSKQLCECFIAKTETASRRQIGRNGCDGDSTDFAGPGFGKHTLNFLDNLRPAYRSHFLERVDDDRHRQPLFLSR